MTTQADYTPAEWQTIVQAPAMAGMVVMLTGKSGPFQLVKEMFAVSKALAEVAQQETANPLLKSVVESVKTAKAEDFKVDQQRFQSIEEAQAHALAAVKAVTALLDSKAPQAEADEFKRWLLGIGQQVAAAAKEGGFLGFGGQQVTEEERAAINTLGTALGVTS